MNFTCRSVLRYASYGLLVVLAFACFYHLKYLQYNEPIINLGQICGNKKYVEASVKTNVEVDVEENVESFHDGNDTFVETLIETMKDCMEDLSKTDSKCKESNVIFFVAHLFPNFGSSDGFCIVKRDIDKNEEGVQCFDFLSKFCRTDLMLRM